MWTYDLKWCHICQWDDERPFLSSFPSNVSDNNWRKFPALSANHYARPRAGSASSKPIIEPGSLMWKKYSTTNKWSSGFWPSSLALNVCQQQQRQHHLHDSWWHHRFHTYPSASRLVKHQGIGALFRSLPPVFPGLVTWALFFGSRECFFFCQDAGSCLVQWLPYQG